MFNCGFTEAKMGFAEGKMETRWRQDSRSASMGVIKCILGAVVAAYVVA